MIMPRNLFILVVMLFMHVPATQAADALGRLFTTPSQRATLNQLRHQQAVAKLLGPNVQGYVKRSDGISTLWLDHKPMQQAPEKTPENARTE